MEIFKNNKILFKDEEQYKRILEKSKKIQGHEILELNFLDQFFFFIRYTAFVHGLGRCSRTTNPAWLLGLGAHLIRLDSAICPFRRRVLPRGTD